MKKLILYTIIVTNIHFLFGVPTLKIPDLVDNQKKLSLEVLTELNTNIRESLNKTGKFKIIDADEKVEVGDGITKEYVESIEKCDENNQNNNTTKISSLSDSDNDDPKCIVNVSNKKSSENEIQATDYYLVGLVNYFSKYQNISKIEQTTNNSTQSFVKISIIYKLIRLSDKKIMASFVSDGVAKQTDIFPINTPATESFDYTSLIEEAENNLVSDLNNKLFTQFNLSNVQEEQQLNENKKDTVSNVIVYKG